MMKYFLVVVAALGSALASPDFDWQQLPPSCDRPVYCDSKLLHYVQMAQIYNDSKTFVDQHLKQGPNETLQAFDELLNRTNDRPSKEDLIQFVNDHFDTKDELENWSPPDFSENPAFLVSIQDPVLRKYAKDIHNIWPTLGRKVKQQVFDDPQRFSLIPMTNGFIIPGGRFRELYYWDTFWTMEGLLISGMDTTVRGMIEDFVQLIRQVGHIPNGSRWYYQRRSQPMLLTAMMSLYLRYTQDTMFLRKNIDALEEEVKYWLNTQQKTFSVRDKSYTLLRYYAPSAGPRPESYYEDYTDAQNVFETEERRQQYYVEIKSAAESGWDFSTRWFIDEKGEIGNLTDIHTTDIIPVDQNAIFVNAMLNLAYFQNVLQNPESAMRWAMLANQWKEDLNAVLWHEEDGTWYDYNLKHEKHKRGFYPSNVAPLWMGALDQDEVREYGPRVLKYLRNSGALDYPGGVPASLENSGEQWDFPNAWAPLVSIIVNALEAIDTPDSYKLAFEVAQTWVRGCHKGYETTQKMFEKYNVLNPGTIGNGGEYTAQTGFGWSNGVVLEFLVKYGHKITASDSLDTNATDSSKVAALRSKGKFASHAGSDSASSNPARRASRPWRK